ncbi:MAG: hypothetical protein M1333_00645, partial [Patescibacteria group bacterium]|nr:hypothetical protein [Patescibacteria group bacterium]
STYTIATSTDWTTFNNKQAALVNPVTGTGTATQIAFWDTASSINSDSNFYWDNTNKRLGVGGTPGTAKLYVNGNVGIGTTSPNTLLTIGGSLQTTSTYGLNFGGDTGASLYRVASGHLETGGNLSVKGTFYALNGAVGVVSFGGGAFISLPNTGFSGIGIDNSNPWIAYVYQNGNWFTDSTAGDTAYRNTSGKLLFGNSSGNAAMAISSNNVGISTTTPNATLHDYGSNAFKYIISNASTYTIATSTDNIIYMATTTVASTVNLPACVGSVDQVIYTVKDKGGNAGTNNITVTATAGNTIDGAATKVLNTNYSSTKVQCVSGSGWFVLP